MREGGGEDSFACKPLLFNLDKETRGWLATSFVMSLVVVCVCVCSSGLQCHRGAVVNSRKDKKKKGK